MRFLIEQWAFAKTSENIIKPYCKFLTYRLVSDGTFFRFVDETNNKIIREMFNTEDKALEWLNSKPNWVAVKISGQSN